jgi:hypothetical protein
MHSIFLRRSNRAHGFVDRIPGKIFYVVVTLAARAWISNPLFLGSIPSHYSIKIINMKHSFLHSTLSLAFIISLVSIIVMAFMKITPDKELLGIISSVIGAYI